MSSGLPRLLAGAATLAAAMLSFPTAAAACSCAPSGPPCQAYFSTDAVFVATVQSITTRERPAGDRPFERRLVRLAIDGPSRGVTGTSVDVWTGTGGGDCGFGFKEGLRYVVYAYRQADGTLSTGICSRTALSAAGSFKIRAFDRLTYIVQADVTIPRPPSRQARGSVTVRMSADTAPVRIVLDRR